jgi:pyruvate formate lyase activating enzyme
MALEIKGFVETSFCDWDGKISTVVFLPGCNLRCPFCQNGDLVLAPGRLTSVDFEVVSSYLDRQKGWIDGVVLTGGEPTIWDDLPELAGRFKSLGLLIKLDTNGTNPGMLEEVLRQGLLDYVAMDVKAPLDHRYDRAAGVHVDLEAIGTSIGILLSSLPSACEFRTTLVPGLVGEDEVVDIARALGAGARYVLQTFVPEKCLDTNLERAIPYSDAFVVRLTDKARTHVKSCFFRGRIGAAPAEAGGHT